MQERWLAVREFKTNDVQLVHVNSIVRLRRVHFIHDDATELTLRGVESEPLLVWDAPIEIVRAMGPGHIFWTDSDDETAEDRPPF